MYEATTFPLELICSLRMGHCPVVKWVGGLWSQVIGGHLCKGQKLSCVVRELRDDIGRRETEVNSGALGKEAADSQSQSECTLP